MFLPEVYKSKKKKIFFENEVRYKIFKTNDKNLNYLLHKRFYWMALDSQSKSRAFSSNNKRYRKYYQI